MKFHNLKKYRFVLEPRYYFFGWKSSSEIVARASAIAALLRARKLLPKGYNFKIWDAQRDRRVQILMAKSFVKRLKLADPKNYKKLLLKFAGSNTNPPQKITRLDTHRNGGAFDCTIVDKNGTELWMGTDHDDLTERAALAYYENKKKLTALEAEAKKNRRLLARAMTKAGFSAYAPEWWHWSYKK